MIMDCLAPSGDDGGIAYELGRQSRHGGPHGRICEYSVKQTKQYHLGSNSLNENTRFLDKDRRSQFDATSLLSMAAASITGPKHPTLL